MIISVIGGGTPPPQAIRLAEQVGYELGNRGTTVVCGGLGGVMAAVCIGAKRAGGTTVGILPGNDPKQANKWVDIPICTGLGHARNVIVVKSGSAVIAIDGSYGTLSEIGHALGEGIPVIGLKTCTMSQGEKPDQSIIQADDPVDAVEKAIKAGIARV